MPDPEQSGNIGPAGAGSADDEQRRAGYLQVSTTVDDRAVADELAGSAVRARVAACGQVVGPIRSTYWWDGRVNDTEEWLILFKTPTGRADALQAHILSHHPYDVPEVIRTPILGGNPAYLAWLDAETQPGADT